MDKLTYLTIAFNNRAYRSKSFLNSIFSIVLDTEANKKILQDVPYALFRDDETKTFYTFIDGNKVTITGGDYEKALFNKNEVIKIRKEDSIFIEEDIETTIGVYLANVVILKESMGDDFGYINGEIKDSTINDIIVNLMVDNPAPGEQVPEGKKSVDQCLNITKQLDYLEGLNHIFVKASSIDMFTVDPRVIELRDRRLKEAEEEGKLNDEVRIAEIINEIMDFDAKLQFEGTGSDFFIKNDLIYNSRKKMFVIFDMIPDYHSGKYTLLRNSLKEGWDFDNITAYTNTSVASSYDRGIATGEGGAEVNIVILLVNRIMVTEDDCNTPRTESVTINKMNFPGWVGSYHMVNGKPVIINKSDKDSLMGKTINMRVPYNCITKEHNLCQVCCGDALGGIRNRVGANVVFIFTQFMLTRMKSMHVSKLDTVVIDLKAAFR